MTREEIYKLSPDEVLELAKQEGLKRKAAKEAAKPKPVVTLATANPEVPLERQRERISEAQRKLIADEERKLQELAEANAREQLRVQRQRAIDFHMEMRLAEEAAERQFMRDLDPFNLGLYGHPGCHRE
jgi:hypothetical protein